VDAAGREEEKGEGGGRANLHREGGSMGKLRVSITGLVSAAILAGILQAASGGLLAAPPPKSCPGSNGCGCSTAYAPVLCGKQKCRYTNFCHAQCAGWTSQDCKDALN